MGSAQRVQIRLAGAGGSHDLSLKLEFLKRPAVSVPAHCECAARELRRKGVDFLILFLLLSFYMDFNQSRILK